ncbi:MAG: hypothetical protein CMP26_13870 [Roseibacillus sp.]|nr:hypothetical protein [Roseibacillus sp.]HAO97323.1 hypothetical protein [Verrucomicrobiales bacterium]
MGYADREYFRDGGGSSSGRLARTPVVKWLLILNLGVFVLGLLVDLRDAFEAVGCFTVEKGIMGFQIWRFITFQFLHVDFGHLLFNSIAIYFFGAFVEQQLRSRAFLAFYLLCGGAGALGYAVLVSINSDPDIGVVGASGGIFGILAVAALIAPDMRVQLLFPPVTLTMRLLAIIMLAWGAFVVLSGGRNAGGEAGHLGGALAGFLMWKIPMLRQFLQNLARSQGGASRKRGGFGIRITKEKKSYTRKLGPKIKDRGGDAAAVDRILDKINEHGLQSLTEEERRLLSDSGNK